MIVADNYGPINKSNLRRLIRDYPNIEFRTISSPIQPRDNAPVTIREALLTGDFDQIEVRYHNDRDLAIITAHSSGAIVVR
jgi:hypothetical protein